VQYVAAAEPPTNGQYDPHELSQYTSLSRPNTGPAWTLCDELCNVSFMFAHHHSYVMETLLQARVHGRVEAVRALIRKWMFVRTLRMDARFCMRIAHMFRALRRRRWAWSFYVRAAECARECDRALVLVYASRVMPTGAAVDPARQSSRRAVVERMLGLLRASGSPVALRRYAQTPALFARYAAVPRD
jgi:hypothetical protein